MTDTYTPSTPHLRDSLQHDFNSTKCDLSPTVITSDASGFSAVLTGQGQYSLSPLITGELISFGGLQTGRGYDPGGINGDHGLGGSAELRYDKLLDNSVLLAVEPYAYFDTARTFYIQRGVAIDASLMDQSIASVGGGIRSLLAYNASLGLEVSQTLDDVQGSDAGHRATKIFVSASMRF